MNTMVLFGAAMVLIGIYLLIQAVKMKKSNEIVGNPILADEDARKCKDKAGFITFIYGQEMACGIAVIIIGMALLAKELLTGVDAVANVVILLALLVVLFFLYSLSEARKRFLF